MAKRLDGLDKDMLKMLAKLPAGYTYAKTRKNHVRVMDPAGRTIATSAGTASDRRSLNNFRGDLRRAGVQGL